MITFLAFNLAPPASSAPTNASLTRDNVMEPLSLYNIGGKKNIWNVYFIIICIEINALCNQYCGKKIFVQF